MQKYRQLKENCTQYQTGKLSRGTELIREKRKNIVVVETDPNK